MHPGPELRKRGRISRLYDAGLLGKYLLLMTVKDYCGFQCLTKTYFVP